MKALVFALLVLAALSGFGQQKDKITVYYMDGSVFIGSIVYEDPFTIDLRLATSDTISLNTQFIKKTKRFGDYLYHPGGAYHYKKGYFGLVNFGVGWHEGYSSTAQANFTVGKRLTERWSVGAGIGRESSDTEIAGLWEFHVFTTFYGYGRYYLGSSKVRTYVDTRLGYGKVDQDFFRGNRSGGLLFSPGFGIHFATRNSVKWHLGISQYVQQVSGQVNDFFGPFGNPITADYDIWYNRTVFRLGIEIK